MIRNIHVLVANGAMSTPYDFNFPDLSIFVRKHLQLVIEQEP